MAPPRSMLFAGLLAVAGVELVTQLAFIVGIAPASPPQLRPLQVETPGTWSTAQRAPLYGTSATAGILSRTLSAAVLLVAAAASRKGGRQVSSPVARQASLDIGSASTPVSAALMPAQLSFAGDSLKESVAPFGGSAVTTSKTTRHLLMPKNIKWKKPHKPSVKPYRHSVKWKFRGYSVKGSKPFFGKYALQALEEAWISSKQIENVRRAIIRTMERKGKLFIRVFPHSGITQRVAESRMGAGKGSIEYWVMAVRPNFILFEVDGVAEEVAANAFRKAAYRLPCKVRFIKKEDGPSQFELGLAGKPARGGGDRRKFEGAPK